MMFQKLTLATVAAYTIQSASADSIYGITSTTDDFSTLAAAIDAASLTETLSGEGTFTVFAPPNSAFDKLDPTLLEKLLDPVWQPQLKDLILYHALGDEVLAAQLTDGMTTPTLNLQEILINLDPTRVNENSNVIAPVDLEADNGIVHGIDTLLTPTSLTSNVVDIALADDDFTTLVDALTAAGLVDTLSGDGPFTVFAPTNEAFAALPEGTLDDLLLAENKDKLAGILKYHVVAANALSSTLTNTDLPTLEDGETVAIVVSPEGDVKVNDASVIIADIIASNGIVHVIDTVLLPPDDTDPVVDPVDTDPVEDPVDTDPVEDPVDTDPVEGEDTAAPTKNPTAMPTTSGAFAYGTTVAAVAIVAGIMTIA